MKKWYCKNKRIIVEICFYLSSTIFTLLAGKSFNDFEFVKNSYWWLFSINITIVIVFGIIKIIFEKNQNNLKNEITGLKEENTFFKELISAFKYQINQPLEDKLCEIYNSLGFDTQYRITVYTYTRGRFFSIGRYSKNTNFRKFGRIAIKDESEILFQAWEKGEMSSAIEIDTRRKMPSKRIVIKFLYEKNNNDSLKQKNKIGVVVFETTLKKSKKLNDGKLKKAVQIINDFLNEKMGIKQDLNIAIKEGL